MTEVNTRCKSECWSITAFHQDLEKLEALQRDPSQIPEWIHKIYGGRELCPTTGTPHFQGCLVTKESRFSRVKAFLSVSRIEKARKREALQKYVMKEETSVGEKLEVENPGFRHLTVSEVVQILVRIHRRYDRHPPMVSREAFQDLVNMFIRIHGPFYITILTDVRTYRAYKMTCKAVFELLEVGRLDHADFESVRNYNLA